MKVFSNLNMAEGQEIVNLACPTGPTFPPSQEGELFGLKGNPTIADGLYVHLEGVWNKATNEPSVYYSASYLASPDFPRGFSPDLNALDLVGVQVGKYDTRCSIQFSSSPGNVSILCYQDLDSLKSQLLALPGGQSHVPEYAGTLTPGVYTTVSATTHTGQIIYDAQGDPDAMFVIRCSAAHAIGAASTSILVNGAQACNVFWLITGAFTAGATCNLKGTYISSAAIGIGAVFTLEGRLLTSSGAVGLSSAYYEVPLGKPSGVNMGILQNFALYTAIGAISNTVVNDSIGDVCSGGGAITGMTQIKGSVFTATSTLAQVEFKVLADGVVIPTSVRCFSNHNYSVCDHVTISCLADLEEGQDITFVANVLVGGITVGNSNSFATKVD